MAWLLEDSRQPKPWNSMIQLAIHVDLLQDKLSEFIQSWESFSQHVKNKDGLVSYTMKPAGKSAYDIELNFTDHDQLEQLQHDSCYEFLIGAIETLGNNSHTKQVQLDKRLIKNNNTN